jgi:hypothetical protein
MKKRKIAVGMNKIVLIIEALLNTKLAYQWFSAPVECEISVSRAPFMPKKKPKISTLRTETPTPVPLTASVLPRCPTAMMSVVSERSARRAESAAGVPLAKISQKATEVYSLGC